jgi:hypothetical protein
MGYLDRFKVIIKSDYGNGRIFCESHGIDYGYYRKVTQNKRTRGLVRWVEMFVVGYELGKLSCDCGKKTTPTE